jgi:opacity protein-like surface antigen
MSSKRFCSLLAVAGFVLCAAPAFAQRYFPEREGAFRIHFGQFRPEGDSAYWNDAARLFTGEPADLEDASFGLDYVMPVNRRLSVLFSGSVYNGQTTRSYLDFEDNFGDRIRHDASLDVASATVGLVVHLSPPRSSFSPYLGAGGGAFPWSLEEDGDFIDFRTNPPEIFTARLNSEGVGFGYYLLAGLEASISQNLALFAESRWTQVDDELDDDFEGFGKIDLSGTQVSFGLSWNL